MKIHSDRIFFQLGLWIVIIFWLGAPGWAQGQKGTETFATETQELETAIQLLENPQEAQKLASQLRSLLDARKRLLAVEKTEQEAPTQERTSFSIGFEEWYHWGEERVTSGVKEFFSAARAFPTRLQRFQDYLSKRENFEEILALFIRVFIALGAGFGAWILLRSLTRRVGKKWGKEPASFEEKMGRALLAAFLAIYPWLGLWVFFSLFSWFFPIDERLGAIIDGAILAILLFQALNKILYFFLSPEIGDQKMVPFRDEFSGYVYIWARRILLFSFWAYLLYMPSSILLLFPLKTSLSIFYRIGLGVLGAIILAQCREPIRRHLHLASEVGESPWKSFRKKTLNVLSGNLYLLGMVYVSFWVILSLSGLKHLYAFFLSSTWQSALVLFLAVLLWYAWKFVFRKLFEISQTIREKYPELEEKVNQYINYLGIAGHSLIIIFSGLTLLNVWGVRIYSLLAANMAWVKALLRIPAVILFAFLLVQVGSFIISKFAKQAKARMLASSNVTPMELEKRVSTLTDIFRKAVTAVILSFAAVTILSELGFDIMPILAGAGIVGLAVGFGAQNLVRDIISGLFYIFENRIRVGDVAIINGTGGLVEQVNLRTSVLRGLDGTIHVFPNGAINSLSNMTYEFSYYLFDVGVAYKEDVDRVVAVLKEVGEQIMQEEKYRAAILQPLEILGVDKFGDSAVIIKARIKTLPVKQWFIGREMNRRIKKRFDEVGIEIPFPHQSFYFGEASKPISIKLEGLQERREEIKAFVREVLAEPKKEDRGGF